MGNSNTPFRRTKTGNYYAMFDGAIPCCVFVGKYGAWSFFLDDKPAGAWFKTSDAAMAEAVRRAATPPPIPDCLKFFGLAPPVNRDALMAKYRELAVETHPDRGGTCESFKRVQSAFESAMELVGGEA